MKEPLQSAKVGNVDGTLALMESCILYNNPGLLKVLYTPAELNSLSALG
jgi:hypothetical protein